MNPLSFLARCVHLENRWPSSRVYQASNIRLYKKHVDLQWPSGPKPARQKCEIGGDKEVCRCPPWGTEQSRCPLCHPRAELIRADRADNGRADLQVETKNGAGLKKARDFSPRQSCHPGVGQASKKPSVPRPSCRQSSSQDGRTWCGQCKHCNASANFKVTLRCPRCHPGVQQTPK